MEKQKVLTVVSPGGHLTQALCCMRDVREFHLVTTKINVVTEDASSVTVIKGTQFNPLRHFTNIFKAFVIVKKIGPTSVFSTGGPICIPFAIVCKFLGVNFVYLDTLSRVIELSNTARFLLRYKLASKMMSQWEEVAEQYEGVEYYGKTFDICNDRNEPVRLSKNA